MGNLKFENGSEIIAAKDQALQTNKMQQRYYKQNYRSKAKTRIWQTQYNTSPSPLLTLKDMKDFVLTTLWHMQGNCSEIRNEQWLDHVSKLVETNHEVKFPIRN